MTKCDVMPQQQKRPPDPMPIITDGSSSSSTRVRRTLFGPVDHEETLKFVERELEKQMKFDQEKWNFDFANEKPLNGPNKRYEWVKVNVEGGGGGLSTNGHHHDGLCDVDDDRCSDRGEVTRVNGFCDGHDGTNGQMHITDFMRKRKHASSSSTHHKLETTHQQRDAEPNGSRQSSSALLSSSSPSSA